MNEQDNNFNLSSGKSQPVMPVFSSPAFSEAPQETQAHAEHHTTLVTPQGDVAEAYDSEQARTRVGREGVLKEEYIFHIETHRIKANPNQPRRDFDDSSLKELSESIREHGLLHPVVVSRVEKPTPTGQEVEYRLIAGERRWRAAQLAGLPTMPAIIKESTEKTRLELGLVENLQRENLNPIETAIAFKRLIEEFNLSQRQISQKMGKSQVAISNTLRLLSLPQEIQNALASNKIFEGHARAMLALTSSDQQFKLFEAIMKGGMSVRETEEEVRTLKASRLRRGQGVVMLNPYFRELIDRLETILGTKVTLVPKGEGGKLTIEYYSSEELEDLISRLAPPSTTNQE